MNYTNFELVETRPRPNGQLGLYAISYIPIGALIGCYAGRVIIAEIDEAANRLKVGQYELRQIAQIHRHGNMIIGMVAFDGFYGIDFINHSCVPTALLLDKLIVKAGRNVDSGEEITLDYRSWDIVPEGIHCWCADPKCDL